jgi:methylated-DNA-[protein]-cysteine S-methyltransferase
VNATAQLYDLVSSPLGRLLLTGDGRALTGLWMDREPRAEWQREPAAFADVAAQLEAYFAGRLTRFELPLNPSGTQFQRSVWTALTEIPYGQTTTYRELARSIGRPAAVRAVGAANGRNPISVIVPCHRVLGSSGALTGYGGGLERKRDLLELEAGTTAAAAR